MQKMIIVKTCQALKVELMNFQEVKNVYKVAESFLSSIDASLQFGPVFSARLQLNI
jgi:hypothetical protein